jgi:hypothetical protein
MKLLLTPLWLVLAGSITHAQQDTTFFGGVRELQKIFAETSYAPIRFEDTALTVIESISNRRRAVNSIDRSLYLEKQKELVERDYGLSLTGGYLENVNPTTSDLEDNLVYTRKFSGGVEWNVLNDGYFENRMQARILDEKIVRHQMMNASAEESFHYLGRFDYTIYVFNKVKIDLLNKREKQLLEQYGIVNQLVLLKMLTKEDLVNLQTRLAEVESLAKVYQDYNTYLGVTDDSITFDYTNLPLIDLDYEEIFSMLGMQTDSLLTGGSYSDYYKWYHEINVGTFARYNYYDMIDDTYRSFGTVGVNVAVPIPFNHKLRNEIEAERWKYENEKLVQGRVDLQEDILNTGYEFRYKLKQFIGFYQKRKVLMERLRIEKVKVRLGDVNIDPLGGLALYDDLLQIDIELVDLLQNLYLKALKIHSKIPGSDIRAIVVTQQPEKLSSYLDKKDRAVYVWSKTFEEHTPVFLAEYAVYNEFEKVVIAVHEDDSLKAKKELFMNYANENGDVYFMIGNNQLLFEKDVEGRLSKIIGQYPDFTPKGIHLDIEPHTFDNWGTDRQNLLNQYVEFVGKASTYCKSRNMELDISIPPNYNPEIVDKLLAMVDHIYFMCYENVKTEYLVNKLTTFVDNGLDQVVVAFRTEDFVNRIEMEAKIEEIREQTGITQFAYHDLRRMIAFDRKSIE